MFTIRKYNLLIIIAVILSTTSTSIAQIKRSIYVDQLKTQGFHLNDDLAPFYHGVASGDPLSDRVIIWTRLTPLHKEASETNWKLAFSISWRVATDTAFTAIVREGEVATDESKDFTVKVDVDSLKPNTTYYYQFEAFGKKSIIGTTKTSPDDMADLPIKLAFVSGNSYSAGYFNTYQRIAELKDLSAVIVLSGYIDENEVEGNSNVRKQLPAANPVSLEDFRYRYAQYHLDKALMMAHAKLPFIVVWQHQALNNSIEKSNNWNEQKQAAEQAFSEWLPVRVGKKGGLQRNFSFGKMLDLFMIDTHAKDAKMTASLNSEAEYDNTAFIEPQHKEWLTNRLNYSNAHWKVLTTQNLLTSLNSVNPDRDAYAPDIWDNHPKEKESLLGFIKAFELKNIVFASGGFKGALAAEVADINERYNPSAQRFAQAIEIAVPSITSPSLRDISSENGSALETRCLNRALNSHIKMANFQDHGFVEMIMTQKKINVKWNFAKDVFTNNDFKLKSQLELNVPSGKAILEK